MPKCFKDLYTVGIPKTGKFLLKFEFWGLYEKTVSPREDQP